MYALYVYMCVERGRKLCRMRGTKQINRVRRQIRTPLQTRCVNTRRQILLILCLYCLLSQINGRTVSKFEIRDHYRVWTMTKITVLDLNAGRGTKLFIVKAKFP